MSRKHTSIRWTKEIAASEFGVNPRTLTDRIRALGIEPGSDGKFSTKQICTAVLGDEDAERLRKITAEADLLEAKRKVIDREYVPLENALKAWEFIVVTFRQKILNCPELSELRRSEILEELRDIKKDEYFRETVVSADSADAETP